MYEAQSDYAICGHYGGWGFSHVFLFHSKVLVIQNS